MIALIALFFAFAVAQNDVQVVMTGPGGVTTYTAPYGSTAIIPLTGTITGTFAQCIGGQGIINVPASFAAAPSTLNVVSVSGACTAFPCTVTTGGSFTLNTQYNPACNVACGPSNVCQAIVTGTIGNCVNVQFTGMFVQNAPNVCTGTE